MQSICASASALAAVPRTATVATDVCSGSSHEGAAARGHAAARRPELRSHGRSTCSSTTTRVRSGVVLNRPTDEDARRAARRWKDLLASPPQVFAGGPVETDALIALALANARWSTPSDDSPRSSGRVASADLTADPAFVAGAASAPSACSAATPAGDRVSSRARSWPARGWCSTPSPTTCSPPQPDELWRTVLRRQGGRLGWLANAPDDLSAN